MEVNLQTFVKKAIRVKAFQWWPHLGEVGGVYFYPHGEAGRKPVIDTLEGQHLEVSKGDWIITGLEGERYPVKPRIFAKTYQLESEAGRLEHGQGILPTCPKCKSATASIYYVAVLGENRFTHEGHCNEVACLYIGSGTEFLAAAPPGQSQGQRLGCKKCDAGIEHRACELYERGSVLQRGGEKKNG